MISRRKFLGLLVGATVVSSCSARSVYFDSPTILRETLQKVSGDKFEYMSDEMVRLITAIMVTPKELLPSYVYRKSTLLSMDDFIANSIDELVAYSVRTYELNVFFLKNDFTIGKQKELIETYGSNKVMHVPAEHERGFARRVCPLLSYKKLRNVIVKRYNECADKPKGCDKWLRQAYVNVKVSEVWGALLPHVKCDTLQG